MKGMDDLLLYGKILSTAFLMGGYIFFGLLAGKNSHLWDIRNGWR
ncbi:hypothetical protein MASR1M66_14990 [Aminivibrio sp.]